MKYPARKYKACKPETRLIFCSIVSWHDEINSRCSIKGRHQEFWVFDVADTCLGPTLHQWLKLLRVTSDDPNLLAPGEQVSSCRTARSSGRTRNDDHDFF